MAFLARKQFDIKKTPKTRVELHLHLDGSARLSTLWELSRKKGLRIGSTGSLEQLRDAVRIQFPTNLTGFLDKFSIFMPLIAGDAEAIERVAYELSEDQANSGVAYFEVRYTPLTLTDRNGDEKKGSLKPQDVIDAITRGLNRGYRDFGVKSNQIIACVDFMIHRNEELLGS
ncbi:Adenosine deaminase [Halotydeus destructor]|nr:Adenosine deaminase [Halotydeus destructor]